MLFAAIKLFVNFDFSVIMDKNQERSRAMRILMIEDEKLFGDKIAGSLRREGYEVDICYDGSSAMEHMSYESCDLILLDLNLPDIDGIEILRHLRSYDNETAVLILSARSQISDKVEGLDVGASDYLVKPFHLDELKARIRSLTRRRFIQNDVCLVCGRLRFDTKARKAFAEDREIVLTRKENGILEGRKGEKIIAQMAYHFYDHDHSCGNMRVDEGDDMQFRYDADHGTWKCCVRFYR